MMDIEALEIKVLMEAVFLRYGYDFSQYAGASLTRRVRQCLAQSGLKTISEMVPLVIHDRSFFKHFVHTVSVNVTEMFRDPPFFYSLRERIIPLLKSSPFIKVWCVGVATGEEAYSLAILFKEEGLYDKALIYATDFDDAVLNIAQQGIYSAESIQKSTENYQKSGGRTSFGDYYHADYESAIFDRSLKGNVVFANHNLTTDPGFGEMNLILCRNVLIYFNSFLQDRVLELFNESLSSGGHLCLGNKETLAYTGVASAFKPIVPGQRIFKKC